MEYSESVHQIFIDPKKAYDSVRRETLYNIYIEFGVPMKLARLIMCLNVTYSSVWVGRHLSDIFVIIFLKKEMFSVFPFTGSIKLSAPELFFLNFKTPVYKM